mmetsp:Transcript_2892/g.8468  ORF Transcript_2892/g.8468 Transcript_2892/m.8468 type:complete len:175 (-) Transcript_2892:255-779(-)
MLKRLAATFCKRRTTRIIVLGLDNSGKTSLIQHMKLQKVCTRETFEATPTVGFQTEELRVHNLYFTCFDMSGHSRYRSLWEEHYAASDAIIFVVDSSDRIRMCVAKNEIEELLRHPDLTGRQIPIIFFANKMDLPGALTPVECSQQLDLERISDRPWHVAHVTDRAKSHLKFAF